MLIMSEYENTGSALAGPNALNTLEIKLCIDLR